MFDLVSKSLGKKPDNSIKIILSDDLTLNKTRIPSFLWANGISYKLFSGFVTDLNRILNSQNIYLCRRTPKNNGPIFILDH